MNMNELITESGVTIFNFPKDVTKKKTDYQNLTI